MNNTLELYIDGDKKNPIQFTTKRIINAGYTGRNQEEVMKHIEELKQIGVPAPDKIPTYFPKAAYALTTGHECDVIDTENTGEAEYVLLITEDSIYVAAGSDHTDRKLEESSIPKAKQMHPNFISADVWRFEEVKDQWDEIKLRAYIGKNREQVYQSTTLDAFMPPDELMDRVAQALKGGIQPGDVIFSGTVGALVEGMPFSERFEVELIDEKRNQTLNTHYHLNLIDWLKEE